jgi:hypothetical protein
MKAAFFKKDFTPGYTGHVPNRQDMHGVTSGEINRLVLFKKANKYPRAAGVPINPPD